MPLNSLRCGGLAAFEMRGLSGEASQMPRGLKRAIIGGGHGQWEIIPSQRRPPAMKAEGFVRLFSGSLGKIEDRQIKSLQAVGVTALHPRLGAKRSHRRQAVFQRERSHDLGRERIEIGITEHEAVIKFKFKGRYRLQMNLPAKERLCNIRPGLRLATSYSVQLEKKPDVSLIVYLKSIDDHRVIPSRSKQDRAMSVAS